MGNWPEVKHCTSEALWCSWNTVLLGLNPSHAETCSPRSHEHTDTTTHCYTHTKQLQWLKRGKYIYSKHFLEKKKNNSKIHWLMCFYFSLLKELKRTNPFEKFEYVDYYLFMVMLKNLFMMLYATEVNDQLSLNNMQWSTERNRRKKNIWSVTPQAARLHNW